MKALLLLVCGIVIGVLGTIVAMSKAAPSMMLREARSPLSVEDTVEKIKAEAVAAGWVVSGVKPLHESVRKHGGGELPPVMLVELCQPHHAHRILSDDRNKAVSVMMPCTISVYRKQDGTTWVGSMNAGLLGRLFGGTVAEVMGGSVADEQAKFLEFLGS